MRLDVATLVKSDIEDRVTQGAAEYGERLTTHNGRDALWDAYEEALDLCMYLRQAIEEREDPSRIEDIAAELVGERVFIDWASEEDDWHHFRLLAVYDDGAMWCLKGVDADDGTPHSGNVFEVRSREARSIRKA